MSFSLFSFNPASVKNESMNYFKKRSTEMYVLRYRCPNDEIFDPLTHLNSLKSVFFTGNEFNKTSDEYRQACIDNIVMDDLLTLEISNCATENINNSGYADKKRHVLNKQEKDTNSDYKKKTTFFDEISQGNKNTLDDDTNDMTKRIFRFIKEGNYPTAFEYIDKAINYYAQYELRNAHSLCLLKSDTASLVIYTALFGLILSYATNDVVKQYEYFDIISEYPIEYTDLPHFYHLIDEMLVTNNGIKQLTLAHLLGFQEQFFVTDSRSNPIMANYQNKKLGKWSFNKKRDNVFSQIMNKKFGLKHSDHDYDNDSFNDDFDDYSDNDYDYYDFESDNDFGDDDFDHDFLKTKHFINSMNGDSEYFEKRASSSIRHKVKKDFFQKHIRMHERKKLIELNVKKRNLIESQKNTNSNNNVIKSDSEKVKKMSTNDSIQENKDGKDTSQWKTISNQNANNIINQSVFAGNAGAEIEIEPLLNVVFRYGKKAEYSSLYKNNDYFNYKLTNSSKVVDCHFMSECRLPDNYEFNNSEYNYCCLPHFQQQYIINHYKNESIKNSEDIIDRYPSRLIKISDSKETIKSVTEPALKKQIKVPFLTYSLPPEEEKDESLVAAIEEAISKSDVYLSPRFTSIKSKEKAKSKPNLKQEQEKIDDFIDKFESCPIFKTIKTTGNQKSKNFNDFRSNFDSDDEDPDEDGSLSHIMNILMKSKDNDKDLLLSHINPIISIKDDKITKKINFIGSPGTKTTTEIKKTGNGTTITKITTTSSMKIHNSTTIIKDDTNIQPPPRGPRKYKKK